MSEAGEVKDTNKVNGPWDKIKGCESRQLRTPKSATSDLSIPVTTVEANKAEDVQKESDDELQKAKEAQNNKILNSTLNANAAEFVPLSNQNLNCVNYEDQLEDDVATYLKEELKYLTLNPGKYDEVVKPLYEVIESLAPNENALQSIVSVLINECISEPNLRYNGARICSDLTLKLGQKFRNVLLTRCQQEHTTFIENTYSHDGNFKDRIQGFGMLLAELFLQITVNGNHLIALGQGLLKILQKILVKDTEKGVKSVCQILKLTGSKLEKIPESRPQLDELFSRLKSICCQYVDIDPNLKFIVTKVLDMRADNWGESSEEEQKQQQEPSSHSLTDQPEYYNDPVFFGPDGKVISEEETSFLHESVPISEEPEDYVCDDDVLSDEVDEDFRKFLEMKNLDNNH